MAAGAQSVSQIKSSKDYLWGEGKGETNRAADQMAIGELLSQISTRLTAETNMSTKNETSGQDVKSSIKYESVMRTYSAATLNNAQRLIISDEPNAHILRYIKRSDLDQIWKSRADKVKEFCRIAHQSYAQRNIGDALRYYYWADVLLQSIPNPGTVSIEDEHQSFQKADTWLPHRINELMQGISVKMLRQNADNLYELSFFYQGKPVAYLDFTYYDGQDWSPVTSAQDGVGLLELRPGYKPESVKTKVEYQYYGEAQSDKEVYNVLNSMQEIIFSKCSKNIRMVNTSKKDDTQQEQRQLAQLQAKASSNALNQVSSNSNTNAVIHAPSDEVTLRCQNAMEEVQRAVRTKNYASMQKYCTPEGYKIFDKLIHYGNARIVGEPRLVYTQVGDEVYCRALTLNFKFSKERTFIEDVAFAFNQEGKIDNIQFGLGKIATNDITDKPADVMSDASKVVLVNFLENYKTAYALKRADYLESIFSDDALIITGKVLKQYNGNAEQGYRNNQRVQLTQMDKATYIKGLRRVFASNEFVNIKFANNRILKSAKGGELYAIQIKQDYFSTNYGDSGYLFLLVDVNDPDHPIIHVRAWQEMPDAEWGLIDLGTF